MTTNTQPNIDIIFKTLSGTAIQRGSRGKVGLVLIDDTAGVFKWKSYKRLDEVNQDESNYTSENFKAIKDTFIGTPAEVIVFKVNESFDIDEALKEAKTMGIDWIGTNSEEAENQTRICDFVVELAHMKSFKISSLSVSIMTSIFIFFDLFSHFLIQKSQIILV